MDVGCVHGYRADICMGTVRNILFHAYNQHKAILDHCPVFLADETCFCRIRRTSPITCMCYLEHYEKIDKTTAMSTLTDIAKDTDILT